MTTYIPIFIIIGPPAVGKSTTSRALAARFSHSLHIPVDDFRNMVVSGRVLPGTGFEDELAQQVSLARASAVHMAFHYRNAGFMVVIEDFFDRDRLLDYQALLSQPAVHKVILLPMQDVAHERNLNRSENCSTKDYIDEGIRDVYQQLNAAIPQLTRDGWMVIDTGAMSVEKTVATILQQSGVES
jgi:cytidylate kinase